ncbi:hypothetical protein AB0395_32755 [Streptosporangium sp. NPDC051023]|uniref:hypothetical protein n=1 Tax=Streptosporangium sp. NPDC051023 TaxID=3155410 RepID=UPI00344DE9F5
MTDTPAYRLYTSKQAAGRAGGGLTESLFDRLAASGEVEATYIGGKLRWTDAQIAGAIAHHARGGSPATSQPFAVPPSQPTRASRQQKPTPRAAASGVTPLRAKPGGRYATS